MSKITAGEKEGIYIVYLKEDVAKQLRLSKRFMYAYFNGEEFEVDGNNNSGNIIFTLEDCVSYSAL